MKRTTAVIFMAIAALLMARTADAGPGLDAVKARGELICGVGGGQIGFSSALADGKFVGLGVDICKAIGIAALGDSAKVKFVPLVVDRRFPALKAGEVDVLVSGTTLNLSREADLSFDFPAVYLFDGQGFLVPRKLGKRSVKDLNGVSICVAGGTTTERNLANYFAAKKMTYKPVVLAKVEDMRAAFFGGRCDAYTGDAMSLYATRAAYAPVPQEYMVLPELISKEPLSLIVRSGDSQFSNIVRWAFYAMVQAEESGITSKNVDEMAKSESPDVKRFLGVTPGLGKALGVDDKWVYSIIKQIGNYGESFERNLGAGSPLRVPRGLNAQWSEGGMQYSPPFN